MYSSLGAAVLLKFSCALFFVLGTLYATAAYADNITDSDLYRKRAEQEFDDGEVAESIRYFSRAIELNEENIHAYLGRGESFSHFGDEISAVLDLVTALKLADESEDERMVGLIQKRLASLYGVDWETLVERREQARKRAEAAEELRRARSEQRDDVIRSGDIE